MDIGGKIKYHRVDQNITQAELARGICSKSYLSKIENNTTIPSEEIIKLLFKRLGKPLIGISREKMQVLQTRLDEWYEVIKNRDIEKAKTEMKKLSKIINTFDEPTLNLDYDLYLVRYYLLLNLDEATKSIEHLKSFESNFTQKQRYYFHIFYALYMYLKNDILRSLEFCNIAESLDKELNINEAELYYLTALAHSRLHHVTMAINYSNLFLDKYKESLIYEKNIEIRIILIINYIRIKDFEHAQLTLTNLLKAANKIDDKYLIGNIKHNFGYLYSEMGDHSRAISYYLESLNEKSETTETYLNTLFYLAEEYILTNNLKKALEIINDGIKIAEEVNSELYLIKFEGLKYQIIKDTVNYQKHLEEKIISYFEKMKSWIEVSQYAAALADSYSAELKHKNASHYYKLAYEALKKSIL